MAMLSSKNTRFVWSKQDRTPEVSLFRLLCAQWRPTARVLRDAPPDPLRAATLQKKQLKKVKPVWTPWLWVDGA